MPSVKTLTAALAATAALTAGGLALPSTSSASDHAGTVPTLAKSPSGLIQGVVSDAKTHRYLDDVAVEAVDADGEIAASAITYASDREDGPQHGYYYLHVAPGDYTVRFEAPGYVFTAVQDVTVTKRKRATLDPVVLAPKVKKIATKTAAEPTKRSYGRRESVTVLVSVGAAKNAPKTKSRPTGKLIVSDGDRRVGTFELTKRNAGYINLKLGTFGLGKHYLTVYYAGNDTFASSFDSDVVFKVTKSN